MAETGTEARPPLLQANAALYLDFDGTLAAFASHPDGVTVHDSLPALLAGLREQLWAPSRSSPAGRSPRSMQSSDRRVTRARDCTASSGGSSPAIRFRPVIL